MPTPNDLPRAEGAVLDRAGRLHDSDATGAGAAVRHPGPALLGGSLKALIVPGAANAFGIFWMRLYAQGAIADELIQASRGR